MALVDDLACDEVIAPSSSTPEFVPPSPHLDAAEVLDMMLQHEARSQGKARNPKYLSEVQRHGMELAWRRHVCCWMFEIGRSFELAADTVACAVHFMDQYLSCFSVNKSMLQILSMVCMYVASKMHEPHPISMDEIDLLSQRKFSRKDIRDTEAKLLEVLDWKLNPPTTFTIARDFIQILDVEDKQELEASVMDFLQQVTEDYDSLRFRNSTLGIAAVHVMWNARHLRPTSVLKEATHTLELCADQFVVCYRWLRDLRQAKLQQTRFISIEDSKSDPSRAISPTCVDAAICVTVDQVDDTLAEILKTDQDEQPESPAADPTPKKRAREEEDSESSSCALEPIVKKTRVSAE